MVITMRIPIDENLVARTMLDLKRNRPAGHPTEDEAERMKQNKEFQSYKLQREPQIMREHLRKYRYKGGANQ